MVEEFNMLNKEVLKAGLGARNDCEYENDAGLTAEGGRRID